MKYKLVIISIIIILIDQISKYMIRTLMTLKGSVEILRPVLYLTYTKNTGAGFSILTGMNTFLIIISILIIAGLIYYFKRFTKAERYPLSLILGGAIGNLIDRIIFGHVIDFINVRVWPIFNIADSAITIGIIWLLIIQFRRNN